MANLTNIIGGQPYYDATTGNSKNNLLDFWKGTQAQYDLLNRTGGATAAPTGVTTLTLTGLNAVSVGWTNGDTVYVTAPSGSIPSPSVRTVATISNVASTTSLVLTLAAYTSDAVSGYTVDKYDAETLYLITA